MNICDNCGTDDLRLSEWWASDDLWMHVTSKREAVLCAPCFDFTARRKGWLLRWKPEPFPGVPTPIELNDDSPYNEYIQSFGRSMVARAAKLEELVEIMKKEIVALRRSGRSA